MKKRPIGFTPLGVDIDEEILPPEVPEAKLPKRKYSAKQKSSIGKRFYDDYDAIYEAYTNPKKKLSPTQLQQLSRWKFARQWFSEFQPANDAEVITALRKEYGISTRQAYIDVSNCKRLFASIETVNEEFEKIMFIEGVKRLRKKGIDWGTPKGFEIAARCDATLAKVKGYDREKEHIPEPKIVQVMVTTDLNVLGLQPVENKEALLKKFWQKKEQEKQREIEDINFEDIINNPRNERDHAQ